MATVTRRLAALLGASGAGLTDSATSSQITTTSLKDDAVTSAKIGTDQVGADALSSSAIAGAADIPANSVGESELSIDLSAQSVPHIIPGVLQPAVAGNDLSGTALGGSYVYGTAHTDGHKYYYTDIKGSKPIKDPRIGAHFGSQRHKFKSLQLLEQETGVQSGDKVFSVDGREWCRVWATFGNWAAGNQSRGVCIQHSDSSGTQYLEFVGYFNQINIIAETAASSFNSVAVHIDGVSKGTDLGNFKTAQGTPLSSRYVDSGSVMNIPFTAITLGLHTCKITFENEGGDDDINLFGIELIAQDTASIARRSEIKIPKQNVVSFGKKFEIGSDDLDNAVHPHYDPFTTMSYGGSGTTLSNLQSLIDKDTSLGLDNWKAGTSNYHRPWNGGRVVKWVDSDGTIKTSVTMMPPNAQNTGGTAPSDGTHGDTVTGDLIVAGTNNDTINFNTSAIDHSLSEVAKTFHFREFGNGGANAGNGGSYPDLSTLVRTGGTHNGAFIMDDGLTALSYFNMYDYSDYGLRRNNDGDLYLTFIGTGLTIKGKTYQTTVASNLPYGTHIFRQKANGTSGSADGGDWYIDGVLVRTFSGASGTANQLGDYGILELTIHQPKRPAVPEDCVVLTDYMLMADFVPNSGFGPMKISKGVREVDCSRDIHYDAAQSFTTTQYSPAIWRGLRIHNNGNGTSDFKLPFFGNGVIFRSHAYTDRADDAVFKINSDVYDTNFNSAGNYSASNRVGCTSPTPWDTSANDGTFNFRQNTNGTNSNEGVGVKNLQLGLNELHIDSPQYVVVSDSIEVATPIHTSHHYQPFESPFLHELVGGDRNMEQTNLVCSPDGKTWDQITRDTSYIGSACVNANTDQGSTIIDEWRGSGGSSDPTNYFNKDWAIAYDRIICLKDGMYEVSVGTLVSNGHMKVWLNYTDQNQIIQGHDNTGNSTVYGSAIHHFKRGDYIAFQTMGSTTNYNTVTINRL